jgi:hypothetical protein
VTGAGTGASDETSEAVSEAPSPAPALDWCATRPPKGTAAPRPRTPVGAFTGDLLAVELTKELFLGTAVAVTGAVPMAPTAVALVP